MIFLVDVIYSCRLCNEISIINLMYLSTEKMSKRILNKLNYKRQKAKGE